MKAAEVFISRTLTIPSSQILSANQRLHHMERARRTKSLRQMGQTIGQDMPALDHAHITVEIGWPDKRRRDVGNMHPTAKALIDGMVADSALLPDDSDEYLIGPDLRARVAGVKGHVVITLRINGRKAAAA